MVASAGSEGPRKEASSRTRPYGDEWARRMVIWEWEGGEWAGRGEERGKEKAMGCKQEHGDG